MNGSVPKSQHKKKKKTPPSSSSSSKGNSPGKETVFPVGPRHVSPPPVSGPWGNPDPSATSVPPPGFLSSPVDSTSADFSDAHVRLLRHRALFAFRFLVGKAVELRLVAPDERYAGILDCVDPDDFSVVLKNARRLASPDSAVTQPFADGSTVIFRRHQLAHVVADGAVDEADSSQFVASSGSCGSFCTDTEISGTTREHLIGRQLETASAWLDPALDTDALEDGAMPGLDSRRNQIRAWNQFEANEKLFGVVSSYDESIYTTKLDKSKISSEQARAAATLAQEIEQQTAAGNFHLQEERGQWRRGGQQLMDVDEEARYSSVDRRGPREKASGNGSVYVPPALRKAGKAQGQSSGDEVQEAEGPEAGPSATAPVACLTGEPASSAPAGTGVASKPLSFSEAVTGRSAPAVAAAAVVLKDELDEKKEVGACPQDAVVFVQVKSPDSKAAAAKVKGARLKKKESAGRNEKKTETKADHKAESSKLESSCLTTTTSTSTTTTARKVAKDETLKAASKKGLNLNAKEFKLSASAAEFTPSFSVAPVIRGHGTSPYRGGSPGRMPYPHPAMGYPPQMQEEWMYDGAMGVEEGGEMGMPPYMQGGYAMPMGPNGVPMMYSLLMPQQNMRMMGGQRGNFGGYQQQGYTPRGYCSPLNGGIPGAGVPFAGMPGGAGPQPPLPPSSGSGNSPRESSADGAPAAAVSAKNPKADPVGAKAKQMPSVSKKQ
uniref:LsmAD domain-containing protein n=2 Tax=Hyaloperonospora arabidopsidis (strain Emoy2) TaxID=559515 RepID=M4B549_HYAAE